MSYFYSPCNYPTMSSAPISSTRLCGIGSSWSTSCGTFPGKPLSRYPIHVFCCARSFFYSTWTTTDTPSSLGRPRMHGLRQRGVGMLAEPYSLPHRRYVYNVLRPTTSLRIEEPSAQRRNRAFELRATFEVTALAATTRTPLTYPASPQGLLGVSARTSSSRTPWTSSSVQVSVPSTTSCQQYQPSWATGHRKMVTVTSPNLLGLPVHRL